MPTVALTTRSGRASTSSAADGESAVPHAQDMRLSAQAMLREQMEAGDDSTSLGIALPATQQSSLAGSVNLWKSQLKMVIHHSDNTSFRTRCCKLDIGSCANLLSQQVVDDLGMIYQPYDGDNLRSIGAVFSPVGVIHLEWHVMNRNKTYTTKFFVIDKDLSMSFDALIGEETIQEIGFYSVNRDVFRLG